MGQEKILTDKTILTDQTLRLWDFQGDDLAHVGGRMKGLSAIYSLCEGTAGTHAAVSRSVRKKAAMLSDGPMKRPNSETHRQLSERFVFFPLAKLPSKVKTVQLQIRLPTNLL